MLYKALITKEEADSFLYEYLDWKELSTSDKLTHIDKASVYVQTAWTCVDVVWSDTSLIPEEIKEAIAYYAYANFKENLYGNTGVKDEFKGSLRSTKGKLEGLEEETSWYRGGKQSPSSTLKSFGYPDALMRTYCTKNSGSSVLVRV